MSVSCCHWHQKKKNFNERKNKKGKPFIQTLISEAPYRHGIKAVGFLKAIERWPVLCTFHTDFNFCFFRSYFFSEVIAFSCDSVSSGACKSLFLKYLGSQIIINQSPVPCITEKKRHCFIKSPPFFSLCNHVRVYINDEKHKATEEDLFLNKWWFIILDNRKLR